MKSLYREFLNQAEDENMQFEKETLVRIKELCRSVECLHREVAPAGFQMQYDQETQVFQAGLLVVEEITLKKGSIFWKMLSWIDALHIGHRLEAGQQLVSIRFDLNCCKGEQNVLCSD